jgi:hypothetical protein
MPWDVVSSEAQEGCRHGGGTDLQVVVRIPVFPHRCTRHDFQDDDHWVYDASEVGRARCSRCGSWQNAVSWREVADPTSGTMVIDSVMMSAGRREYIYRCVVCRARYSNSPAFGAQGESFFCGTAGNEWR